MIKGREKLLEFANERKIFRARDVEEKLGISRNYIQRLVDEKFEAMVTLGLLNGRMKDFWDLNYLTKHIEFDGKLLQNAIKLFLLLRAVKKP